MASKLGIIAGGGPLPGRVIAACRAAGRPFFVLCLEGFTDPEVVGDAPHAWIRLGAGGKGLELLHESGAEELVMIGPVRRPTLAALRPDGYTARKLAQVGFAALGDDGIFKALNDGFAAEGFRVVGVESILEDLVAPEGVYTKRAPDAAARTDIERGVAIARGIGALDIGQAAVVQQGVVLGVEAAEGTDALLARCGGLRRDGPGGVLVKVRKPAQQRHIDLPTIGVRTIENAAAAGLAGVAVQAGAVLVVDRDLVVAAADRARLFVVGVPIAETGAA